MQNARDKTINILFVDDEIDFLEVITKRMTRRNMTTSGVADGEAAVAFLEKKPADVVVLDVKIPGSRNGIEILKEIKARWPMIEVIMLTGHAMLDAARSGMQNGAFDYIVKPADFDELFYKITDAARKKRLQENKLLKIENILKKQ